MGEKRWNREDVLALDKKKWRTKIHHLFIKITPTPSRIGKAKEEEKFARMMPFQKPSFG